MPKRFTLTEAERLLPEVDKLIREAVSLKDQYQESEQALHAFSQHVAMMGGVKVDREFVLSQRADRDRHGARLKAVVEEIHGFGCVIKDLDTGLVDFPTLFRGREVYLCWKMGESAIGFWHGTDEGFAGRKPIDQDFLDGHQGDMSQ